MDENGLALNYGHGHVYPRPDGVRARCGGPMICAECAKDLAKRQASEREQQSAGCGDAARIRREHPLATRDGLELVLGLLFHTGAMCPTCGWGTRVTSKNWAKCKKCGERVRRRPFPEPPQQEHG